MADGRRIDIQTDGSFRLLVESVRDHAIFMPYESAAPSFEAHAVQGD